jgi:hypothetical protein
MMYHVIYCLHRLHLPLSGVKRIPLYLPFDFYLWYNKYTMQKHPSLVERRKPLISADPAQHHHAEILLALEGAGWQIDADEPHAIEASDGERYGVAVFFQGGIPVEICYGDGQFDRQFCEAWTEAPGILRPAEVVRLFNDEKGER